MQVEPQSSVISFDGDHIQFYFHHYVDLYPSCHHPSQSVVTINEHQSYTITCSSGVIDITYAYYGKHGSWCDASGEEAVLDGRCYGKTSCTVTATNSWFGDPCWGTFKEMTVTWSCFGKEFTSHIRYSGEEAVLDGRCYGKTSCTVTATNSWFVDPCNGTFKEMTVTWNCFGKEFTSHIIQCM